VLQIFFGERGVLSYYSSLESDCKISISNCGRGLIDGGLDIVAMRDATRGGLSAVLNEWADSSSVTIEIVEESIPISDEVRGACEMLGLSRMIWQ